MATEKYILVNIYSERTQIGNDFLEKLNDYGLIKFEQRENDIFIDENDISEIERLFRLHNDLGINYEGLDVINQMLNRIHKMERELNSLQKRLCLYE